MEAERHESTDDNAETLVGIRTLEFSSFRAYDTSQTRRHGHWQNKHRERGEAGSSGLRFQEHQGWSLSRHPGPWSQTPANPEASVGG